MTPDQIINIVMLILPWVVAIGFSIYSFYLKYKKLPQTIEEWETAFSDVVLVKDKTEKILKEVKSFFDPEKPMIDTPIETIKNEIPANSFMMSDDSLERVLKTCADEQERTRVRDIVFCREHPEFEGEECCVYDLETSGAIFKVSYGVPELIAYKQPEYKYLSQKDVSEILDLLGDNSTFAVMSEIMRCEREGIREYTLKSESGAVIVKDGQFRLLLD